jgi:hypothetical protein
MSAALYDPGPRSNRGGGRDNPRRRRRHRLSDHRLDADGKPGDGFWQSAPFRPRAANRAGKAGGSHTPCFFRDNGYQSRPTQVHSIDLVTDKPHVSAEKFEEVLRSRMVIMAEPNPITPDGLFGIFLGQTFIVTETGHEVVDDFPLEIAVAGG